MCGILGSVDFDLPVEKVQRWLQHRGPDEQTEWRGGAVQFIHTRLAIQELTTAGRQPMHLNNLHIIYNGEIYNHLEVRKKYSLRCATHSDTETLLHLFQLKGIDMLQDLDGMFAFAIYDDERKRIWVARDRAGEKPLYYSHPGNGLPFVFTSELKTMSLLLKLDIDHQRISNFISVGYMLNQETPFKHILELPGGHFLEYDLMDRTMVRKKWWSVDPFYQKKFAGNLHEAMEETDGLLQQSVKRRMVSSDLEVGTFLSGGIDSGVVTAIASNGHSNLKSFTISFDGFYDEGPQALVTAKHLKTDHRQISISLNELQLDLEKIFSSYGEPIMDDSIIPSYYVAREAKRYLTVILNGDGGDELFGGYRRYLPFSWVNPFDNHSNRFFNSIRKVLPFPSDKMGIYNYLYRFISLLSVNGPAAYYSGTNDLIYEKLKYFVLKPDLRDYDQFIEDTLEKSLSPLKKVMNLDFNLILHNILLGKMDIASMINSLETRSPFLSKELMEFAPTLPDSYLVNGRRTKYLLRQLSSRYLPQEIINQPKRGFEIPLQEWIDGRIKQITFDHLSPSSAYVKTIVKPRFLDKLLAKKIAMPPERRAKILFALLSVESWKRNLRHG